MYQFSILKYFYFINLSQKKIYIYKSMWFLKEKQIMKWLDKTLWLISKLLA